MRRLLPLSGDVAGDLAQLVGYDFPLGKLARRMKCQQCGEKRVRVRAVEPGER
jgi:hypothetical protein